LIENQNIIKIDVEVMKAKSEAWAKQQTL
jgi:hypothetical protein